MNDNGDKRSEESFASLFERSGASPRRQRRLSVGEEVDVVVAKVTADAAFADIDGKREVFLDRTTLLDAAGQRLELTVGTRIKGRVAEIGSGGLIRIEASSLHHRGQSDEEERVQLVGPQKPTLSTGAVVKGTVTRIESYGVFVQIEGTTGREGRGLLPCAEALVPRNADPHKHFTVGQQLETKIVSIDETGRIRLSIKALQADQEKAEFRKFAREGREPSSSGAKGFGTLGDLMRAHDKRTNKS